MPEGYLIKDTHDSLIELATDVCYVLGVRIKMPLTKGRKFGDKLALSYSGGMDSTANLIFTPLRDTIMAYNERSFTSAIDHRNALRLFEAWKEILKRCLENPFKSRNNSCYSRKTSRILK